MRSAIHRFVAMAAAACAVAVQAAAPPLSGFWKMQEPATAPKPALTAQGAAAIAKMGPLEGDTEADGNKWCLNQGMPHVMDTAGPIDIIQGGSEIVILAEHLALARHIYTARQKHINPDIFDNSSMGDSIGTWKNGVLTVDTIGFAEGIGPYGAPRGEGTKLVETFTVTGDTLAVTSTWTDKAIFAKPFRYTLTYSRLPADYQAQDYNCDPRNNGLFLPGAMR